MSRPSSRQSTHLEPPRKSVELQDTGTAALGIDSFSRTNSTELTFDGESSDGEDHFSDASEGRKRISRPVTPSSPIPRTRVERVDDRPSHGEEPGTEAFKLRSEDAVPDEVEILSEGRLSKRNSRNYLDPSAASRETSVPRTVVEKLDPDSPSYGDEPGTEAYQKRLADATPDIVLKNPDPSKGSRYHEESKHTRTPSGRIPETIVTRADDEPAHSEAQGTQVRKSPALDAAPDKSGVRKHSLGSPTLDRSIETQHPSGNENPADDENDDFGDDFDDFEEGAQVGADDDFGDFDDGFDAATDPETPVSAFPDIQSDFSFPLIDIQALSSLQDLMAATQDHLNAMFPSTTPEHQSQLPNPEQVPQDSPIFPSERSRSLWKQLITPPPLQPPNWTQSRIRRLFLISLGVPVDLDEILPPSKQKKLILPDINLTSSQKASGDKADGSLRRMKSSNFNKSSASVTSSRSRRSTSRPRPRRAQSKPAPHAPPLDMLAVRRLCTTTKEKLDGFSDDELKAHVQELEDIMQGTQEVLEYWLRRRDGARKEKEAFEGVIENLVRHARRVRK